MHPELSLVFLTVLGGIGQGIFIALFVFNYIFSTTVPETLIFLGLAFSLVLQMLGTASSLFHLGHPFRVWKAIRRLKTSWLSREVFSGGVAFAFTFLYFLLFFFSSYFLSERSYALELIVGCIAFFGGIAFLISSSMLYASIRFIKEWSNSTTPFMFFLMGITGGLTAIYTLLWFIYPLGSNLLHLTSYSLAIFLIMSLVFKLYIYRMIDRLHIPFNLHTALSVTGSEEIVQMDMGTPYEHFNTKEFSFPMSKGKLRSSKLNVILLSFVIPIILLFMLTFGYFTEALSLPISLISFITMLFGFILERRLFFIQGNHIQNLYYNRFKQKDVLNPLLSKARKGTPVP